MTRSRPQRYWWMMMNSTLGRVGLVGALILCGALTGCGDNGNEVGFEEPDGGSDGSGDDTSGSDGSGDDTSGDTGETGVGGSGGTADAVGGSGGVTGDGSGGTADAVGGSGDVTGGDSSSGVGGSGDVTGGDTSGDTGETGVGGVGGSGGYPACNCETLPSFFPETGENCECLGACHFSGCVDGYNFLAACNGETWQVDDVSCEPTHCGPQVGAGLHCAPDEVCRVLEGVGSSLEYSCEPNPCLSQQVNRPTSCECAASLCEGGLSCEMREEGTILACVP